MLAVLGVVYVMGVNLGGSQGLRVLAWGKPRVAERLVLAVWSRVAAAMGRLMRSGVPWVCGGGWGKGRWTI